MMKSPLDPLATVTPGLDYMTKKLVMASGRSWWEARYRDGKLLSEWDTTKASNGADLLWKNTVKRFLPGPAGGSTSRWEEVSKRNMVALRLVCPNGNAGVLEDDGANGRFFQLKSGTFDLGPNSKFCEAQIIGMVLPDDDDRCVCWAWEVRERRLVKFEDHFHNMAYRNIGMLSANHLGVRL